MKSTTTGVTTAADLMATAAQLRAEITQAEAQLQAAQHAELAAASNAEAYRRASDEVARIDAELRHVRARAGRLDQAIQIALRQERDAKRAALTTKIDELEAARIAVKADVQREIADEEKRIRVTVARLRQREADSVRAACEVQIELLRLELASAEEQAARDECDQPAFYKGLIARTRARIVDLEAQRDKAGRTPEPVIKFGLADVF